MTELQNSKSRPGGRILKETREAKGISLDTVHAATKIPMDALKSIEEGYKVRTLTPFYVKGFMKMYAQYLGLDINQVVDDYHAEQLPAHIPDEKKSEKLEEMVSGISKDNQKKIAQVIGVMILIFLVIKVGAVVLAGKASKKNVKAVAASVEKDKKKSTAKKTTTSVTSKKPIEKTPAEKKTTAAPSTSAVKEKAVAKPNEVNAAVETADEKSVTAVKKVRLTIRAKKSGWLQVKVDNNLVFQSTLEEGAVESWTAEKIIELSGKNIHNLEFEVNGRILGGLGREDRSARRVIITETGLAVKNSI